MHAGHLLVHLIAAGGLIVTGRRLQLPWWVIAAVVLVALLVIQRALRRLAAPAGHLGAAAVATDDPLMLAALTRARQTWGTFLRLYPEHRETTIVKFRLRTRSGEIENVWGDLVELREAEATVLLRTPPVSGATSSDPRLTIPVSDIVDWQIMFPDSTLRGGFTQQATFRIIERDRGRLPRKYIDELARYREVESAI